ncbi:MAG TPA: serine/threonine-protein kinase, partial [Actinomycetota bacterium]
MSVDPRVGSELAGYRIDQLIGRGGMGVVYLAEDLTLGRKVALKLLAPELAQDPKFRERFVRESRLAASLEHPNIITIYEARERDGLLYISMRYVHGTDLKALIESQGALDPARAISILTQVAGALDTAHAQGLIHRDVKPGNILITPGSEPGSPDRVYLSDFGLTKRTSSDSGITATGQFVGSLDYAAPEQFEGKALDGKADQYSLACVLFECLTGEVPFKRDNEAAMVYAHLLGEPPKPSERRPTLPGGLDRVVAKGMAKKPEDRYASCQDLVSAAAGELGVEPAAPSAPGRRLPEPSPSKQRPRVPLPAVIGIGVLVIGAIVAAVILAGRGGSKQGASLPPSTSPGGVVAHSANALVRLNAANGRAGTTIRLGHPLTVDTFNGGFVGSLEVDLDRGVAVGGEGSVWITNGDDNSVTRIDPLTSKAVTIDVGHPTRAIAVGS